MLNEIKIKDALANDKLLPVIDDNAYFREALETLEASKLGVVCICDQNKYLKGILTDGDIRRIVINNQDPLSRLFLTPVSELMIKNPFCLYPNQYLENGLREMNNKLIWVCPVIDENRKLQGVFHMQWALKKFLNQL